MHTHASAEPTEVERRGHPRHALWFPVQIDGDDFGIAVGVAGDVSIKGLTVHTHGQFPIGAPVVLMFRVGTDHPLQQIEATIVRSTHTVDGLWPYRVAVEFDEPLPQLETGLRLEARAQARG